MDIPLKATPGDRVVLIDILLKGTRDMPGQRVCTVSRDLADSESDRPQKTGFIVKPVR